MTYTQRPNARKRPLRVPYPLGSAGREGARKRRATSHAREAKGERARTWRALSRCRPQRSTLADCR
eukprot:3209055-Prymnesium_polylepis.1